MEALEGALEPLEVANGQDGDEHAGSAAEGQERLLFFAAVLVGHKVEVQVSCRGAGGSGWSGMRADHFVQCTSLHQRDTSSTQDGADL